MSYAIVNVENKMVEACAMFHYRGYTVSMSTIFGTQRPSVAIFRDGNNDAVQTFDSVQDAIEHINYA